MSTEKIRRKAYRNLMLLLLGVTRALSRTNFRIPSKWLYFVEGVRANADILHNKISSFDDEIEEEFLEKEEMIERRIGKEKFYNEKEIDELRERLKEIRL